MAHTRPEFFHNQKCFETLLGTRLLCFFFTNFPRVLLTLNLFLSTVNISVFEAGSNISDLEDYYGNS